MTSKNIEVTSQELINLIEKASNIGDASVFFQLENSLMEQIFNLEKEKARYTFKEIQVILLNHCAKSSTKAIQYYFIILSSAIARRMKEDLILTDANALTFNISCVTLIERNLTSENAFEIGDELMEFCYYILKEQKLQHPLHTHETVNEVIQYINENVEKQLIVEEIAKRFNVSTSHLSRIFREYTSVTLVEFITIRKIEEVQYYLRFTEQKIVDIARSFHFCNQSYFTRVFKKYTGVTPMRFRKELDGNYFQFTMKQDDSL